MELELIDLKAQYQSIKASVDRAVADVFSHGQFIRGPEVLALEDILCDFVGCSFCITCANGTDALQLGLMAIGLETGDEVITPAFSYVAAAEAIALLGATPVFIDIDPASYTIDVSRVESLITERTKAIIPVSLFGQCAEMDKLSTLARKYGVTIIEDAAQSFGAEHFGKRSCNLSSMATTSFFPSKPLGCYGDGGAIFTNDEEIAERLRMIAVHGQKIKYRHDVVGMNSRLDSIQAAILLEKLKIFEWELARRDEIATRYTTLLSEATSDNGCDRWIGVPDVLTGNKSVWAQYTLRVTRREALREALSQAGVPSAIYYPLPLHHQKAFFDDAKIFKESEKACEQVLSIPMHPYLDNSAQEYVISSIVKSVFETTDALC